MGDSTLQNDKSEILAKQQRLEEVKKLLPAAYTRWKNSNN